MLELRAACRSHFFPASEPCQRQRGFTAVELMVTVAIVAVLAALAAPSFTSLADRWRVRQAAEELQSTFYFARSEAIKHGGGVTISANGGVWGSGWKVEHAGANDPLQEAPPPSRITVTVTPGNNSGSFGVDRWGMLKKADGSDLSDTVSFLLSPENKTATDFNAQRLCVSRAGRILRVGLSVTCPS